MFTTWQRLKRYSIFAIILLLLVSTFSAVLLQLERSPHKSPGTDETLILPSLPTAAVSIGPAAETESSENYQPGQGVRGSTRAVQADEANDWPHPGCAQIPSLSEELQHNIGHDGDQDWYRYTLDQEPDEGKLWNITLYLSSLGQSDSNDWIYIKLYMHWDFNQDEVVDDQELILLHQESGNNWHSTGYCWAIASHLGDYYVCIEGQLTKSYLTQ